MVVTFGQQYNVGEKPTVILYMYINRQAGTPNKTKTKDTMSLDYNSICYIGSKNGWVSIKEMIMENCPITFRYLGPFLCEIENADRKRKTAFFDQKNIYSCS